MKRFHIVTTFVILMIMALCFGVYSASLPEKNQPVNVLKVKGPIFSATAKFIERGIRKSEADGAICIIQMDTPGGLIKSMRQIVQDISASRVPVVVYVYPQGGMATSAGTYIAYAAHVAAMAPGTHIGSAHPVAMGRSNKRFKPDEENKKTPLIPLPTKKTEPSKKDSDEKKPAIEKKEKEKSGGDNGKEVDVGMEKATNALVALIRSLAEKNNRNADWGEDAVRKSVSVTADKAVELKVVEIKAENIPDLLEKLDGRKVTLEGPVEITLHPDRNRVKYIGMTGIEKFLQTINNPRIAVILMLLGMMGLYFEITSPGFGVPGIIGSISIILALYTLGTLPINYAALALIILSFALFFGELVTPTFGAFTLGGVVAFVLGAMFLIPAGMPYLQISRSLIFSLAGFMALFSFIVVNLALKSLRVKPVLGKEGMTGKEAIVRKRLGPAGMVLMEGELWKAKTPNGVIEEGALVIVESVRGLTLTVRREDENDGSES